VTAQALERYLAARRGEVDRALKHILAARSQRPATLQRAMRYAVLGPGKRIRPVLALAAAEAVGGARRRRVALPYACAIEMIHAYSLVHDDLPAMDDDAMRRGRPTLHVRFGEAMAILAGDALLTEAFAVIGRANSPRGGAAGALDIVAEVATAAGPDGMVAGQVVDLQSEGRRGLGLAHVAAIHRRKTGALIRAAVRAGALAASASREQLRRLTAYAEALGLAFQIVDDILDETAGIAVTGKKGGGDRALGKATYPALLGLAGARTAARRAERRARAALAPLGPRGATLVALVQHVVARSA
jgi:geranylgeranyl diphosphate synthase type II